MRIDLPAESTGPIELLCERSSAAAGEPTVSPFVVGDGFGLLADCLDLTERVTSFVGSGTRGDPTDGKP